MAAGTPDRCERGWGVAAPARDGDGDRAPAAPREPAVTLGVCVCALATGGEDCPPTTLSGVAAEPARPVLPQSLVPLLLPLLALLALLSGGTGVPCPLPDVITRVVVVVVMVVTTVVLKTSPSASVGNAVRLWSLRVMSVEPGWALTLTRCSAWFRWACCCSCSCCCCCCWCSFSR
jgi:hypothetical protein